jgi:hypothetical protein
MAGKTIRISHYIQQCLMTERFGVEGWGGKRTHTHRLLLLLDSAGIHSFRRPLPGALTNSEVISAIRWVVVVDSKQFKWIHYYISRGPRKNLKKKKKKI